VKVAFGMKAHSGWAALVVIGRRAGEFTVIERRRIELIDDLWAKQPYHAAEKLEPGRAREMVERGIAEAQHIAVREMRVAVAHEQERGNQIAACAVLVGDPMPDWSIEQILAVHIRMHRAEGVLFRAALLHAAKECALKALAIPEKLLGHYTEKVLGNVTGSVPDVLVALGKKVGSPWGSDQKDAALAAMLALQERLK
jgi:hypothetical protein